MDRVGPSIVGRRSTPGAEALRKENCCELCGVASFSISIVPGLIALLRKRRRTVRGT
jgi:hypothetical protein